MTQEELERVAAAVGCIEARLREPLNLTAAAQEARYSKYHFHRLFAAAAGITPHSYIRRRRLTEAAQETLTFQRRTFEITAKKYDLGMVSEEEYLAGKNDVLQAESDLYNTQIELFSAYNNYTWARDYGIV